jgi:hypothetical protein
MDYLLISISRTVQERPPSLSWKHTIRMPRFDLLTGKDFSTEARQYGAESLREAGTKDQNATDYR